MRFVFGHPVVEPFEIGFPARIIGVQPLQIPGVFGCNLVTIGKHLNAHQFENPLYVVKSSELAIVILRKRSARETASGVWSEKRSERTAKNRLENLKLKTPAPTEIGAGMVGSHRRRGEELDVQIADVEGVLFDEFATRFNLVAHQ